MSKEDIRDQIKGIAKILEENSDNDKPIQFSDEDYRSLKQLVDTELKSAYYDYVLQIKHVEKSLKSNSENAYPIFFSAKEFNALKKLVNTELKAIEDNSKD